MMESGMLKRWTNMYLPQNQCPPLRATIHSVVLPLRDSLGLFVVLLIGVGVAAVVLLGEVCLHKRLHVFRRMTLTECLSSIRTKCSVKNKEEF